MHGPACIFWANLTSFSPQRPPDSPGDWDSPAARAPEMKPEEAEALLKRAAPWSA